MRNSREIPDRGDAFACSVPCTGPKGDTLRIGKTVQLSEEHCEAVRTLAEEQYRTFHFHLVRDLLLSPPTTYVVQRNEDDQRLNAVTISATLYEPHFNKADFLNAYTRIVSIGILVSLHIRKVLGQVL